MPAVKAADFVRQLYRFIQDPLNTPQLFKIVDSFLEGLPPKERARLENVYLSNPELRDMFLAGGDRFLDTPFDLQELAKLPVKTLGREFADMMRRKNLDTEFFVHYGASDPLNYFVTRLGKTHDLWHLLTGFDTDIPGEMALMGFYLAQIDSPFPLSLIIGGIIHLLSELDIRRTRAAVKEVLAGVTHGLQAKKLYGVIWENYWATDIDEVRSHFGITEYRRENSFSFLPRVAATIRVGVAARSSAWTIEFPRFSIRREPRFA